MDEHLNQLKLITVSDIMEKRKEYLEKNKDIPSQMNPWVVIVHKCHEWNLLEEVFNASSSHKAIDAYDSMIAGMKVIFATNIGADEILIYRK